MSFVFFFFFFSLCYYYYYFIFPFIDSHTKNSTLTRSLTHSQHNPFPRVGWVMASAAAWGRIRNWWKNVYTIFPFTCQYSWCNKFSTKWHFKFEYWWVFCLSNFNRFPFSPSHRPFSSPTLYFIIPDLLSSVTVSLLAANVIQLSCTFT